MLVKGKYGIYGLGKELSRIARRIPCHIQTGVIKEGLSVMDSLSTGNVIFSHKYSLTSICMLEEISDLISTVYNLNNNDTWTETYRWAFSRTKDSEKANKFALMKEAAVSGNK